MQAIITRYVPANDSRGSRVKAACARGSLFIPYPHELSGEAVHTYAADQLVARFVKEDAKTRGEPEARNPWNRPRVVGCLPSGEMVHVFTERA